MRKLMALMGIVACLTAPAFAQEIDTSAAPDGEVIIPEAQRGGLIGVELNAHLEVTLDEKMRIATLGGGTMPGEADFDASGVSRTEETLRDMGTVGMWAAPGKIGFSMLHTEDQTNLKVSNNTDEDIAYIVALYRGNPLDKNYEYTTTCTVPAGKVSVETWPYLVDGALIVRMLKPPQSDELLCVDPTRDLNNPTWYPIE